MAARNTRLMRCTPDDLFAVLSDGWLYPIWVVGAARMRDVDEQWPQEGSQIHHSLGIWPVMIHDETKIVEWTLRAECGCGPRPASWPRRHPYRRPAA